METKRRISTSLWGYGGFLILVGLAGYLQNPEKAKTALMSGGLFGALSIGLGILGWRGWGKTRAAGLALAAFLGMVFLWRGTVSWLAVFGAQPEKLVAALLISAMLVATIMLFAILLRTRSGVGDSSVIPES